MSEGDERSEKPERSTGTVSEDDERSEKPERAIDSAPAKDEVRPALRIVRGEPTDDEVAALVVAMSLRPSAVEAPAQPRSLWRSHSRNVRQVLPPAPGAWRASGLPR